MKVERINEVQIKFILTKTDLEKRSLDITDLAYGSTKTQELFQDIIETASREFSFNMEETPLMIEAVPMSKTSITIMLTKVSADATNLPPLAEGLLKKIENLPKQRPAGNEEQMVKIPSSFNKKNNKTNKKSEKILSVNSNKCLIYSFEDLDTISETSRMIKSSNVKSSIYKYKNEYMFVIEPSKDKLEKMQIVNRILSEHGKKINGKGELVKAHLVENAEKLIENNAIQIMSNL